MPEHDNMADWNEEARLAELHDLRILDSDPEAAFDEITSIASIVFGMPISFVSLLDASRQWFKSAQGCDLRETPREIAFCDAAIRQISDVMVVHDAHDDSRFQQNPLVVSDPRVRFYAGAPLITRKGNPLGTLCVLDTEPREFGAAEQRILRLLANQVIRLIEYRNLSVRLLAAQQTASAQRSLVEAIAHHTTSGIAMYNEDGDCILLNQAMRRITGGTEVELLAQNIHHIASWRESGIYDCAMLCLRTGQPQAMSATVRRSTFNTLDRRLHVNFSTFKDGDLDRLIMVLIDVSEVEHSRERAYRMQVGLIDHMLDGLLMGSPRTGEFFLANPAAAHCLGYERAELNRMRREDIFDVSDVRLARLLRDRNVSGGVRGQLRMRRRDGSLFEAEVASAIFESMDGTPVSSTVFRDVTQRDALQRALSEQSALLRNLAQHVPGMLYQYKRDPDGKSCFPFSSDGIERIYGVSSEEARHDTSRIRERILPEDLDAVLQNIRISAETLRPWQLEYRVRLPASGVRWLRGEAQPQALEDGSVLWHGYIQDITERKQAEERTRSLAYYDTLTGLPNRALLMDRLRMAITQTARVRVSGAVLFVDLDRFKQINDARGHAQGDKVLVQVAQRLGTAMRDADTVARLGGDEFVILLGDLSPSAGGAAAQALDVATLVLTLLSSPIEVEHVSYAVSASIGISIFANGAPSVDEVLTQADIAMYRAKAAGRNRTALFELAMQGEAQRTLLLDHGLRQALERQELRIEIQSQTSPDGRVTGGECLLRWDHPQLGAVEPSKFIPIAEDNGSIVPIGAWVLEQACAVLATLTRAGCEQSMSVNISVKQLQDEDFLPMVREILQRTGAPPERLVFEVTESLFIHDLEVTCSLLTALTHMGIQISIDDFGTGYSSLRYLQRLPISELKIDRSFVDDLPDDEGDATIVRMIVAMARQLGLRLVAEGVETRSQVEWLQSVGCESMQGWHFSRSTPMEHWLRGRIDVDRASAAAPRATA